jgi:hypothetical protein
MALVNTTLTGDITDRALVLPVASVAGASAGKQVRINNERIGSVIEVIGLSVRIRGRGDQGTAAEAQKAGSAVTFGDPSEFVKPSTSETAAVEQFRDAQTYLLAGAIEITPDQRDQTVILMGAAAIAMTLAAPALDQDGKKLTVLVGTAFAHTITATGLFQDGVTGGAKTTATAGAFLGASLQLQALKGFWHVIGRSVFAVA